MVPERYEHAAERTKAEFYWFSDYYIIDEGILKVQVESWLIAPAIFMTSLALMRLVLSLANYPTLEWTLGEGALGLIAIGSSVFAAAAVATLRRRSTRRLDSVQLRARPKSEVIPWSSITDAGLDNQHRFWFKSNGKLYHSLLSRESAIVIVGFIRKKSGLS